MERDFTKEDSNKALVQASFDRWKSESGSPFELLAPDAEWTLQTFRRVALSDLLGPTSNIANFV
jgi:hypothetical protein